MFLHRIEDWDDAYLNWPNIPRSERWPQAWIDPSTAFREAMAAAGRTKLDVAYGPAPRQLIDYFLPQTTPKGLVVFVHGGYWMRLEKTFWSHLAAGPLAHGYAVAMPSYTLCPDIRISGITREVGKAVEAAAEAVAGPIHLAGHSAGGHLATRMASITSPLSAAVRARIGNVLSISGVHDLRPLMRTEQNATLKIDEAEALGESPALLRPLPQTRLTCWVGANERSEFVRQNALLASIWRGLGAATAAAEEPDRHHFNVVEGLASPDHAMTKALLSD
jgi:acetyl esterase/lipase